MNFRIGGQATNTTMVPTNANSGMQPDGRLRFVPTLEQKNVSLAARISTQGIRKTAAWIERGALDPSVLYTYSFLINELSEAFKLLERRPEGF
jgi:threonine dehydrogenase-like Zn-dependent dehydrogenase